MVSKIADVEEYNVDLKKGFVKMRPRLSESMLVMLVVK